MKENYVDMGNGTLWATSNITRDANGNYKLADNPWDYGCYLSWGDVVGHNLTTDLGSGDTTCDAATATLGGNWRIPTCDDFHWLVDNCNPTWTTMNGVNGELFTNPNDPSKTLFFPAAGERVGTTLYCGNGFGVYWSTPGSDNRGVYYLDFGSLCCCVCSSLGSFDASVRIVYAL